METTLKETKHIFSRLGLSLFAMLIATSAAEFLLMILPARLLPYLLEQSWYIYAVIAVSTYLIGFPLFLLMSKKLPDGKDWKLEEFTPLKPFTLVKFLCISFTAMYLFNIVGLLINALIGLIKGSAVANPLTNIISMDALFPMFLVIGILAPLVEEYIFRKVVIDKLRAYGDRTAIWVSALMFGLFHGNLSQFFYAFALGLIFGYVAVRTNSIRYTILFHMIINLFGSVIAPYIVFRENNLLTGVLGIIIIVLIVAGIIFFAQDKKHIQLEDGIITIGREHHFHTFYLNTGMILFFFGCMILFVSTILA